VSRRWSSFWNRCGDCQSSRRRCCDGGGGRLASFQGSWTPRARSRIPYLYATRSTRSRGSLHGQARILAPPRDVEFPAFECRTMALGHLGARHESTFANVNWRHKSVGNSIIVVDLLAGRARSILKSFSTTLIFFAAMPRAWELILPNRNWRQHAARRRGGGPHFPPASGARIA
jgi:hypothetical protein